MSPFTIYPAIDLKGGQVVRLKQGRRTDSKTFDLTPQQAAETWMDQGAASVSYTHLTLPTN